MVKVTGVDSADVAVAVCSEIGSDREEHWDNAAMRRLNNAMADNHLVAFIRNPLSPSVRRVRAVAA
jgi:hypothetical protein